MATDIDATTAAVLRASVHELKGPANRLRVLAQLLGRTVPLDEDGRKLLGYMEDSAAAVDSVADGFRKYFEICTRPLTRRPVDLNLALEGAKFGMQSEIQKSGAEITSSELAVVNADGFLITWVLQELLTNAIRAATEGPVLIHVCSGRDGNGDPYVAVCDNGPGIESSLTEKIFRPFEKIWLKPGAGLGLTICQKIVERHGGRMWAEDRAGGAEIRFCVGPE
jgi:signal transduction histidine kinase